MVIDDNHLTRLLLFQSVNPESIRPWITHFSIREFSPGDFLLNMLEQNDNVYIILEGKVSVRLGSSEGNPIAYVEEGQCIGEMTAFDGNPPSAFVRAETPVKTLVIPHNIMLELVDHSHGVARNLLYLLSNRLRSGNHAVTSSLLLQREFEQHANVDVLTGLHNRRWIDDFFQRLLARNYHADDPLHLGVLMVDVDHFKRFNDEYGHLAGDYVLRCIADSLRNSVRPTDTVARYGGEEFLVVLPETLPESARIVAERVRQGVSQYVMRKEDGSNYPPCTVSIGVACLRPEDDFVSLIGAADEALYRAKHNGRDQVEMEERIR